MAELRFMGWDRPLLPAVAQALTEEGLTADGIDLSTTLMVCPGARAGRRLLELLVEGAEELGTFLIPPDRIMTIGQLPEALYRAETRVASGLVVRQAWLAALKNADPETLTEAFGPHAPTAGFGSLLGYVRLLDSLNRMVGQAGWSFHGVAKECRRGLLFSDEDRWLALGRLQQAMRTLLMDAGLQDRERARQRALDEVPIDPGRKVILVGLAESPLITRRLLARTPAPVTAFLHAPGTERDSFDEFGMVRAAAWKDWRIPLEKADLRYCDQPPAQAREVVGVLEELADEAWEDQVVIGVPDPSLVPYIMKGVRSLGVQSRYAEGTPTRLAPAAQLLRAAGEYLESGRYASLAQLLRHPDLPVRLHPGPGPEWADEEFAERLPDTVSVEELESRHRTSPFGQVLHGLHGPDLLGSLTEPVRTSAWMSRILQFLATVYADHPIPSDPGRARLAREPLLQLKSVAEGFGELPATFDEEVSGAEAIRLVLAEIQDLAVPPEPEEAAVELVGWLELQLDDARIAVVTGIADPFLPEVVNSHAFLPNAMRARLGIEDNESRFARDAYRLTALLNSAGRVILITGRRNGAGDPLRPSRLLLTGEGEDLARRVLLLTGENQTPPETRPETPHDRPVVTGSPFTLPPEPVLPLLPIPQPFRVTAFRQLLEDPYLWVLDNVRRLRTLDDEARELDPAAFGTLAHSVLERFAKSDRANAESAEAIQETLDQLLDETVKQTLATQPLPTVPLQVEQLRTRLRGFSEFQAGWVKEGWRTRFSEARTPEEGVPLDVDGETFRLSGRVDRIDHNPGTGEWILFDYKTGDRPVAATKVRTRQGVWKDLQLPLYRLLLPHLVTDDGPLDPAPKPDDVVRVAYLSLPQTQGPVQPMIPGWSEADFDSAVEAARDAFRFLKRQEAIAFDPLESGGRTRGPMATLLGRGLFQDLEGGTS